MVFIRNLFAQHELGIARYYFNRKAYLAAARRANDILMNYQDAPQRLQALEIMEKIYRALGLVTLASETRDVLTLNYPDQKIN